MGADSRIIELRDIPRDQAKREIFGYFLKRGDALYPSDAAEALTLDAGLVRDLCVELAGEGFLCLQTYPEMIGKVAARTLGPRLDRILRGVDRMLANRRRTASRMRALRARLREMERDKEARLIDMSWD